VCGVGGRTRSRGGGGIAPPTFPYTAVKVVLDVEQVHRAALAFAVASGPAEQLGHHHSGMSVASQRMTVVAIAGEHEVVGSSRFDRSHHHRLLTDVKVAKTGNFPQPILLTGSLLETADQDHLPIHRQQFFSWNGAAHSSSKSNRRLK